MSLGLTACNSGNKKVFNTSKLAYNNINTAYQIIEQFGEDIYTAWSLGIFEDDQILKNGIEYLSSELNLTEEELTEGIVYAYTLMIEDTIYESISEEDKKTLRDSADFYFTLSKDDLFSSCVSAVTGTYNTNGKIEEAKKALDEAKSQMKESSDKYSDYEYYSNLKEYYTTTSYFFDFCQNPSGSFEQVQSTINDYKNEARDYKSDLDYIFED